MNRVLMTNRADRSGYIGLFLVAMATLMYEVLLTRIFSITMWYHFAFVAVSIAMFGMTLGALLVHLWPGRFPVDRTRPQLARMALAFALTTLASFILHLAIPFKTELSLWGLTSLMITYLLITVPFLFSGICVCLALTRYPAQVGRLYAADLAGAAFGCVAIVFLLEVMNGPMLVFVAALLAAGASVCFSKGDRWISRCSLAMVTVLLGLVLADSMLATRGWPIIRLWWVKGSWEQAALYERWNSFSRVRVEKEILTKPAGWGLSSTYPKERTVDQLYLNIDSSSGTYLTRFTGDTAAVDFLKSDVTHLAHYFRPESRILIVGTGGGRDVLSAVVFGQKSITGVEINGRIINAVTNVFAEFTGHLERRPEVKFVNDEARSFIARSPDRFDIIQISLIDTWAATAAGAYVLSENSLYTTEAWEIFLNHLSDRGLFSCSRWYYNNRVGETWRLVSIANATLRKLGVENPLQHLIIVKCPVSDPQKDQEFPDAVATMLLSRQPFTAADLARIEQVARELHFEIILSPTSGSGPMRELATTRDLAATSARFPVNLLPTTDNQPFFFNMARFGDMFSRDFWCKSEMRINMTAVGMLGGLLIFVTVLALGFVIVPVALHSHRSDLVRQAPLSIYFLAIGLAFMLIEISQMQRLVVLLGHPTYSLSVVLFTLLVFSGLGSFTTANLRGDKRLPILGRLAALLVVLSLLGLITPGLVHACQAAGTSLRIGLAVALLAPAGLFMGMAFPIGMKLAAHQEADITAWFWAINGAASIVASVLAVVLAMAWGINSAWWNGVACYAVAVAMVLMTRRARSTMSGDHRHVKAGRPAEVIRNH